jgi:hypothetical protein
MNHHHNTQNYVNTWKVMSPHPSVLQFRSPYQSSIDLLYEYTSDIRAGQQLFIDYGFDWFEERSLSYTRLQEFYSDQNFEKVFGISKESPSAGLIATTSSSSLVGKQDSKKKDWKLLRDVQKVTQALGWPVCNYQYSTYRQGELIANVDIPMDTIIEVSRALLIPVTRSLLLSGPLEEVLWWAMDVDVKHSEKIDSMIQQISDKTIRRPANPYQVEPFDPHGESKYALLLTGRGPFYGLHGPAYHLYDDPITSNERYEAQTKGNVHIEFYSLSNEGLLDDASQCSTQMLVTIKAIRDIAAGEKLALNYVLDKESGRRFIGENIMKPCVASASANREGNVESNTPVNVAGEL